MPSFTASDGVAIAYGDEGAGRPLLLLHGLMAHRGFFRRQAELAERFRVLAVDLRGHGESRAPGGSLSVERLAQDVGELVVELDLEAAVGVGWSLGAAVLWRVLTGPAAVRFAGAVVVDMTPRVRNAQGWSLGLSAEMCEARSAAIRDDFETFAVNAGQAIFAPPPAGETAATAAWASGEFARNDADAIGAVWNSLVAADHRPLLARIRQPTLVVHGAHSQLYGAETAAHLVAALPAARAVRFDGSGHAPQLEQPALFNATLADFAASLPRGRSDHAPTSTGETTWPAPLA